MYVEKKKRMFNDKPDKHNQKQQEKQDDADPKTRCGFFYVHTLLRFISELDFYEPNQNAA